MSTLLDLAITLTPPPAGSPPEVVASITLRCDILGLSHTGDLLTDPLTQQERGDLHWYLEVAGRASSTHLSQSHPSGANLVQVFITKPVQGP